MKRHVIRLAIAICLSLTTSAAWARGPSTPYTVEQRGHVRSVDRQQQVVLLEDGTLLTATSPRQLDTVQPGADVKVLFVEEGGTKRLQRIDVIP